MRLPTLLTALGLLTLAAVGHSQVQPTTPGLPVQPVPVGPQDLAPVPPVPSLGGTPLPGPVNLPPAPSTGPVPTQPREQTVDQVLEALEHVQAQKAELEKIEKSLKDVLAKKLEQQGERVRKVGMKKDEPKTDAIPEPLKDERTTPIETGRNLDSQPKR